MTTKVSVKLSRYLNHCDTVLCQPDFAIHVASAHLFHHIPYRFVSFYLSYIEILGTPIPRCLVFFFFIKPHEFFGCTLDKLKQGFHVVNTASCKFLSKINELVLVPQKTNKQANKQKQKQNNKNKTKQNKKQKQERYTIMLT